MFISDEGSCKSSLAAGYSLESVLVPALALKLTGVTVSCRWNYRDRCFRLKEDLEGHAGTCWPSCGPLPLGSTVLTIPRLLMNMEARHLQLSPHRPTWSIWLGWGWRDGLFRSTDCWQSPKTLRHTAKWPADNSQRLPNTVTCSQTWNLCHWSKTASY